MLIEGDWGKAGEGGTREVCRGAPDGPCPEAPALDRAGPRGLSPSWPEDEGMWNGGGVLLMLLVVAALKTDEDWEPRRW